VDVSKLKTLLAEYFHAKHIIGTDERNKDETGSWIINGFNPLEVSETAAGGNKKRTRKKPNTYDGSAPLKKPPKPPKKPVSRVLCCI
jgi:hypothetical protein